jgi:hypothetical protein
VNQSEQNPYKSPPARDTAVRATEVRPTRVWKYLFWFGAALSLGGVAMAILNPLGPPFVVFRTYIRTDLLVLILIGGDMVLFATAARIIHHAVLRRAVSRT